MKELKTANHTIKYYDSIEMPIVRYNRFNQAIVMSGIGTDVEGVMRKIGEIMQHVNDDRKQSALLELKNMSLAYSMVLNGIDPKTEAFAMLVTEIDGVACNDLSEEGIKETVCRVSNIVSVEERDRINDAVKKKLSRN